MSRRPRDYDEDDVRVRPTRGSRPRTQRRPRHADAAAGLVVAVDRGRYTCLVGDRQVTAMKARELGRGSIVVGDRVRLVGDLSGRPDTLARVVRVDRRSSVLRRTADDTDPVERIIVANADQMVVVTSLAEPAPQPRLIDRCLVAADDAELAALLCITKGDLRDPSELLDAYGGLGVDAVVTSRRPDRTIAGLDELHAALAERTSVFVGSSGVGKSTLVNALVPDAGRAVGTVNPVTGRGRHTSTSAVALPLRDGGWIIDTPGVRSFGLAHVPAEDLVAAFPDLAPGAADCPPGCTHLEDACALDAWVAAGHAAAERLDSLRRLLRTRDAET
ncbi:MAG: ribosome small subunit-dependent GTPase A [Streptosporangiales bacterium]|nr:ribosome small subunit-dependent GTPase A [Streptosporangiales bacterium]